INILIPPEYQNQINKLTIYNNSGEIIRSLNTNENNVIWDGKSTLGKKCPVGIYFLKLNNQKYTNKVLLTN
ncbi:MAG: T9SS type A sorting domain-containing protein, partial [Bacteroidales bacterium]|nr:T9SS type A sorting domain-containing protein [Bacteroidales bacterium]